MNDKELDIALTNIVINALDAMPLKGGKLLLTTKFITVSTLSGSGIMGAELKKRT